MTSHHEKFEAELAQIEETYNAKKTKFLDSSEEFNKELKKHCVPAVDDAKYKGGIISENVGGFLYLQKHLCPELLNPYNGNVYKNILTAFNILQVKKHWFYEIWF